MRMHRIKSKEKWLRREKERERKGEGGGGIYIRMHWSMALMANLAMPSLIF